MKCSKCKKKKRVFAYQIGINDEKRQVCNDCYSKESKVGTDWITFHMWELMVEDEKKEEKANTLIALVLNHKD